MDFEDAKENIQPLAAGRNASILQAALQTESQEELQQQRRQYEDAIENYTGEDPLEPWFEYIYWIEQSFPSGGKESGLDEVLIKCLTKFEKDERYHQDRRMIKLYIKFIDNHEKPQECYQKLFHQGIGTMVADLYICWAYYYDLMGDFRSADQIFRRGLECQAQPLQELQEAHQHFGFTMSQRILYNDDLSKEKYQSSMQEKRNALISLKSHKKQVGSVRTGAAVKRFAPGTVQVKPAPLSQHQNTIQVFNDEENLPCSIPSAEFTTDTSVVKTILDNTRNQENMKEAGPWSKAVAKKKKLFTSEPHSELGFEILEDQEDNLPLKRKMSDLKPFVYLDGFKSCNEPQENWIVPVTTENQSTPASYPSYDKCLIYPKPNMEFSLDELGCYFWCKKKSVENKFTKKYDIIWKSNIQLGMRMYPNFAKCNVPMDDEKSPAFTDFDPLECLDNPKTIMVINVKLCYPSKLGEDYQFEELLHQRWKNGQKKFKYDINETIAMTQEMEETMCGPIDGVRRKSFFPTRNTIMPVQNSTIEPVQHKARENEDELPAPSNPNHRKSILKRPNLPDSQESSKMLTFQEDTAELIAFKAPSSPVTVPEPQKNNFQIFEDEENNYEANDSCSTQVFNCFIKPHSISTPKAPSKVVKLTHSSDRQQVNFNLPEMDNATASAGAVGAAVILTNNPNCPATLALSPEYNDPGLTLRGKQLSTIMETSEHATGSTGSTKFSINTPDFEVDVHQSRLPLMGNICNLETVDENKSIAEKDSSEKLMISIRQNKDTTVAATTHPNEISRLEQPEDTVPTMPAVRVFEDKTETVPKILITKMRHFPDVVEEKESANLSIKSVTYGHGQTTKDIFSKNQILACSEDMSFFDRQTNLELSKQKLPNSPSPALHNSIFTTSAFMKFQDSPLHSMLKVNDSPERIVKRLSQVQTPSKSFFSANTDKNDGKNKTLDSMFLPNMSTNFPTIDGGLKQSKQGSKNTMENSFLPGFANDTSLNLSPEKYKQSTKDSFLSGFPSVAIGENKPAEDSFVAYLSKNRQQNENKSKEMPVGKVSSDSLLASFNTVDCQFKPKQLSTVDDKENIEKSFLFNLSPDYKKSLFKIPTVNEDRPIAQKNTSFLPNLSATGATPKFQIHEAIDKSGLSNKISLLGLEDPQIKSTYDSKPSTHNLQASYSSPQLKSLSATENATNKTNAEFDFPMMTNPSRQSQFKTDCFFEDNIRTEAFAVNLSMIKNSTLLPSYDLHQSQIKRESLNIVDSLNVPSVPSSIPEDFVRPLTNSSTAFGGSNQQTKVLRSTDECIEIQESDEEPDIFGKSIYYTKTPKTPQTARHGWSPEPQDGTPDEHMNNFFHQDIDLDQTQQLIDNICEARNVNPFNKDLIDAFLGQVEIISFIKTLPTCKLVRKVAPLKKDTTVELNGKVFNTIKLIGEGAFGSVYSGKESHSGKLYALKQERPANLWEYYICLELQSRLQSIEMISGFMKIEYALIGNNASILISNFSRYGSLIAVCNKIKKETLKNVDEYVVMHMASQLLLIMDHLHASNIIHADVKPDNIVLMEKLVFGKKQPTLQLIDFGNSIDMNLFPQGQTFMYIHENESFKCVEMCEKRPWTYQLDLFGLAGIIHVLLFGKYMELINKPTGWTHRTHVPRYLNKTLWDAIFHSLLNINNCQTMPNLQNLRAQLEEELADNDKLVCQKIIEFNRALDL